MVVLMVATEGFLSIDPVGELNVACEGQIRTGVPGHGVANPSWVDRVSVKSEAQRGRKLRQLAATLLFTAVPPDPTGGVEVAHNQEGVPARNSQRTTEEVRE